MAITMILCSTGVLPIYQGIALVMGENIGTTVTSNVAALTANAQARRAALAHMVFNLFGVCWILLVFRPFVDMVCGFVGYDESLHQGDPGFLANAAKLSFVLAAHHLQPRQHLYPRVVHPADRANRVPTHQAETQCRRRRLPPAVHPERYHEDPRALSA
jgi:hypothetical protein